MKETLKNFCAMVFATCMWVLGMLNLLTVYFLFESGPVEEEWYFLAVCLLLFILGAFITSKSERLKTAMEYPLFPNV